ncbi:hypothetical protein A6R68_08518, partial [Neotoma lepida]
MNFKYEIIQFQRGEVCSIVCSWAAFSSQTVRVNFCAEKSSKHLQRPPGESYLHLCHPSPHHQGLTLPPHLPLPHHLVLPYLPLFSPPHTLRGVPRGPSDFSSDSGPGVAPPSVLTPLQLFSDNHHLYVPFSTTDPYNWKNQNPP